MFVSLNYILPLIIWSAAFLAFLFAVKPKKDVQTAAAFAFAYITGAAVSLCAFASAWEAAAVAVVSCALLLLAYKRRIDIFVYIAAYFLLDLYIIASLNNEPFFDSVSRVIFGRSFVLNILAVILFTAMLGKLAGKNLGGLIYCVFFASYTFGIAVKIKYHNDTFVPADLSLMKEFFGIAGDYLSGTIILTCIFVILLLFALIVIFRKKIAAFLKPEFTPLFLAYAAVFALFYISAANGLLSFANIDPDSINSQSSREVVDEQGLAMYTMLAFTSNGGNAAPEGYPDILLGEVDNTINKGSESTEKPNVILILAESLYEVDKTPGVSFNTELFSNLRQYKAADVISPTYGGRTVEAEWEALTGLSNLFFNEGTIAYTSFLNTKNDPTGSVAREFADNGYMTCAIHANTASYYSRDTVFENMGFEDFIGIEDFELDSDDYMGDGRVNDTAFADKIIETLENKDRPAFIFGASLEGHSPYGSKYKHTDIKTEAKGASPYALGELAAYAQTVYNFDEQMGRLIDYCENSDEPYLIYIFGDHLPSLTYSMGKDYLNDMYFKYTTPLYAYSNYCGTDIGEDRISLSRVAVEMINRSGVAHRGYFDKITEILDSHPIVHHSFTDAFDKDLEVYEQITWDLTRGEKYLLGDGQN